MSPLPRVCHEEMHTISTLLLLEEAQRCRFAPYLFLLDLSSQKIKQEQQHNTILTMADAPMEDHKKNLGEKIDEACTISPGEAYEEKDKKTFLQKTGKVLHKVVDATIFSADQTNINGDVKYDGSLAKDVVETITHPGGGKKE
jgi:hypothetical protein